MGLNGDKTSKFFYINSLIQSRLDHVNMTWCGSGDIAMKWTVELTNLPDHHKFTSMVIHYFHAYEKSGFLLQRSKYPDFRMPQN